MRSHLDALATSEIAAEREALDELLFGGEKSFDPADLPVFLPAVPGIEVEFAPPPPTQSTMPLRCVVPPMMEPSPRAEEEYSPLTFHCPEPDEEAPRGAHRGAVSDGSGYYELANLSPGVYEVRSPEVVETAWEEECEPTPFSPPTEMEETSLEPAPPQLAIFEQEPDEPEPDFIPPSVSDLVLEVNNVLRLGPGERARLAPDMLCIRGGSSPFLIDIMLLSPPVEGVLLRDGFALTGGDVFTQEDIDGGRMSYRHDSDARDSEDSFTIATADGAIPPTCVAILIQQRRRAPRLLGDGSLEAIREGITVLDLLDDKAEADGECGVALVGASGAGTWSYSLDEGQTWCPLDGVRPAQARLLGPTHYLRFTARGCATVARLTYRAWDQTTGQAGETTDLHARRSVGGETAYSQEASSASIRLASAVKPEPKNVPEPWGDSLNGLTLVGGGIAIVRFAGEGIWQYAPEGSGWRDCGAAYHGRALLLSATDQLRFLPRKGAQGKVTLSLRSWDGEEGTPGTQVSLASRSSVGGETPFGDTVQTWTWRLEG